MGNCASGRRARPEEIVDLERIVVGIARKNLSTGDLSVAERLCLEKSVYFEVGVPGSLLLFWVLSQGFGKGEGLGPWFLKSPDLIMFAIRHIFCRHRSEMRQRSLLPLT